MSDAPRPAFEPVAEPAADEDRDTRLLGLAVGIACGPAGGFVQAWSGNADGRWHVWLIMTTLAALVGAVSLPLFKPPAHVMAARGDRHPFGLGFLALFGFAVALVAGTFAAFPVGASMGAVGGAVGAVVAGLVWRVRRPMSAWSRTSVATTLATLAAFLVVFAWTR